MRRVSSLGFARLALNRATVAAVTATLGFDFFLTRPFVSMRIESADDGVVVELPTDVDGDAIRLDVEQRVQALLTAR